MDIAERRSQAAKKAWRTRRRKQVRSQAAHKAWETRRRRAVETEEAAKGYSLLYSFYKGTEYSVGPCELCGENIWRYKQKYVAIPQEEAEDWGLDTGTKVHEQCYLYRKKYNGGLFIL